MRAKQSKIFMDVYKLQWDNVLFDLDEFRQSFRYTFVQENEVMNNSAYTLRGMGMQRLHPQGKLLRVLSGEVLDVVVDVRQGSETFGRWESFNLNNLNEWLWIPPGFMHGYLTLKEHTCIAYKCTDYYYKDDEIGFLWNDKAIGIDWKICNNIVNINNRDSDYPDFNTMINRYK